MHNFSIVQCNIFRHGADSKVRFLGEVLDIGEWPVTRLVEKLALTEMLEFTSFAPCEQRYICRSIDVAAGHRDAVRNWARSVAEAKSIRDQARAYRNVDALRNLLPDDFGTEAAKTLLGSLIAVTAFDLAQGELLSFAAYKFLYERMLGADFRPWLVSAFCAAAALPTLRGDLRLKLLKTIPEASATAEHWSAREPTFKPQWIEPVLA